MVGAGNGNDVAVALSKNVGHVDAVEIDPVLLENGELRHPERPYQDPRVTAYVDDGRAFLERTDKQYDLILFALPDSLTLVTGQGSLRLESYLFTREAMQTVRDHLKPGGVFSMYNFYRPFLFERYARTMTEVFGQAPCFDQGKLEFGAQHQSVLTVGRDPGDAVCTNTYVAPATAPAPATDDRPFPYVKSGTIQTIITSGFTQGGVPLVLRHFGDAKNRLLILGGQHGDYSEAQLVAFRSGLRANSVQMTSIAQRMSDGEIKAVADYIAGLK